MKNLIKKAEDARNEEMKKGVKPFDHETICCTKETQVAGHSARSNVILTDYIPKEDKPLTFICVNLHVFQDSAGVKNYNKAHIKHLRMIFDWINGYQTNNHVPNYTGLCTTKPALPQQMDSRIRFILNRIEFYQDDALCNQGAWNFTPLVNAMIQRDPGMDSQLNIFITDPDNPQPATGYTQFPSTNLSFKQYIHTFRNRANPVPPFFLSQHWVHELGHVLGLNHLYTGGGASAQCNETDPLYLYDIFGCSPNQQCPLPTGSNNNIMGAGDSWSISTLQIAKMHYSIQELSVGQYANNICCPKCVAFGASIFRHKSTGASETLKYERQFSNESWAWDDKLFTCPVDGVYHFGVSFQKDALIDGGTSKDVWIKLWADGDLIGTAWSEQTGTFGRWFSRPQAGRRDSVSFTTNVTLKMGTIVKTEVGSHNNEKRHLVDVNFSGHLLCSKSC